MVPLHMKLHRRMVNSSDVGGERIQRASSLKPAPSSSAEATEISPTVFRLPQRARWLTLSLVVGIYLLDSLGRGIADTARNTILVALVGKNKNAHDNLTSKYQAVFELGAMAGPFVAGGVLAAMGAVAANWLIPAAFATVLYREKGILTCL